MVYELKTSVNKITVALKKECVCILVCIKSNTCRGPRLAWLRLRNTYGVSSDRSHFSEGHFLLTFRMLQISQRTFFGCKNVFLGGFFSFFFGGMHLNWGKVNHDKYTRSCHFSPSFESQATMTKTSDHAHNLCDSDVFSASFSVRFEPIKVGRRCHSCLPEKPPFRWCGVIACKFNRASTRNTSSFERETGKLHSGQPTWFFTLFHAL